MPAIKLGTSAYGTISTAGEHDTFTVDLVAGTQYEFRLHGIGANQIIDPVVRLYNGATLVDSNDDAGAATWGDANGVDSRLVYTAATSGTYTIDVGGFNDARTGDYLVTAVQANAQGMVFTNDEVSWQLDNNFWEWAGPAGSVGRQSGPSAFNVGSDLEITVDLSGLDATEQNLATWALFTWSMATSITFRDVGAGANAEITFLDTNRNAAGWQANAGADTWASGTSGTITHSFVHIDHNWVYGVGAFAGYGTTFNSYSFETYMHEIGHALGLGHAGNYDVSGSYGTNNYYLNDALAYSIMSYWQAANDEFDNDPGDPPNQQNTFVPASFRYMLGPQPADIIAIRELYGLDVNSTSPLISGQHSGYAANQFDNHYGYNSNGSIGIPFLESAFTYGADGCYTIFDTGGTDIIDYSGFTGAQTINLNPETFSSVNGGQMNLAIARGVTIENVIGGSGVDTITGNSADNTIDGGAGADTMAGGAGNDTYVVDNAGDIVTENANEGTDTIRTSLTNYSLASRPNVENLTFTGAGGSSVTGNARDNVLDNGAGAGAMGGGAGNDTYVVDNADDVVTENANEGIDTVNASIGYALGANVENLTLLDSGGAVNGTGNGLDNSIIGNASVNTLIGGGSNDILDGRGGADTMLGGIGNDSYFVDNAGDVVTENANEGTDTINASIDYTLAGLVNIENLTLIGSGNTSGTGNSAANTITGNGGNNGINGAAGADTMAGGAGNDVYFVDNAGDLVIENANQGTDTVNAFISYTLGANVENLTLTGSADLQGYGNASANTLYGNAGSNLLDGGAGADGMFGGAGNDTYFVDNSGDAAIENANEGSDSVFASASFTLGANVENLILQGSADLQGYGNNLANTIYGNNGNNLLNGGGGVDLMAGGVGNDVYFADDPGDACFEVANQGNDSVFATCSYGLAADVESLVLQGAGDLQAYGNNQANTIYGNTGNNLINGGGGIDLMAGGAGNDIYYVNDPSDVCFEVAGQGNDAVFATCNYGLSADIETLILQGSAGLQGYGNNGANTIYGNSGGNLINGGGGADTMLGGAGNDVYFVDNAGDGIIENANEGNDAVLAGVSYVLSANVEGLVLQGAANLDGIGNAIANSLSGNSGNNLLDGGGGADQLTGNGGNDTFRFTAGQANGDVIVDFAGNGAAVGDSLLFFGYGVGATFTNIDATHWQVNYNGGSSHDIITFSNGATFDPTDFSFI